MLNYILFLVVLWILTLLCHLAVNIALRHRLRNIATVGTRLSAFAVSAFFSFGVFGFSLFVSCYFLSSPAKHPITHPASIIIMLISGILLLIFIGLFIFTRVRNGSVLGSLVETALAILYSPALFFTFGFLYNVLEKIYHRIFPII